MFLLNECCCNPTAIKEGTRILESTNSNGRPQVTIKTILQTCDDLNKNKRMYPKDILVRAVEKIKPMMESNTLVGEMDHPVPTGVSETDSYRHFVVLYDRTSHVIKDIFFEGNLVCGIVKTTSTDKGYNMAGLIMDGIPVGFSLRAMGESEMMSGGITKIKEPFDMITYDCVSNPSHAKARMTQIVSETVTNMPKAKALVEGVGANIYMDRSNLLTKAFKNMNQFNKYKHISNKRKLNLLMEHIDSLCGRNQLEESRRFMDKFMERYVYGSPYDEGYLYDDSKNPKSQIHTSMLDYLYDYLHTKYSDSTFNALFDKYFK